MRQNLRIDPSSSNIDPNTKKVYNRILVPIHLITTLDSKYLAVFNDGQLYMKSDIVVYVFSNRLMKTGQSFAKKAQRNVHEPSISVDFTSIP